MQKYAVYWRSSQPVQRVYWPENVIDWLGKWRPTCVMQHARGQKLQSFRRKWPFCMDLYSVATAYRYRPMYNNPHTAQKLTILIQHYKVLQNSFRLQKLYYAYTPCRLLICPPNAFSPATCNGSIHNSVYSPSSFLSVLRTCESTCPVHYLFRGTSVRASQMFSINFTISLTFLDGQRLRRW